MFASGDLLIISKGEEELARLLLPACPKARLNSMSPSTRTQSSFFSQPVVVHTAGRGLERSCYT